MQRTGWRPVHSQPPPPLQGVTDTLPSKGQPPWSPAHLVSKAALLGVNPRPSLANEPLPWPCRGSLMPSMYRNCCRDVCVHVCVFWGAGGDLSGFEGVCRVCTSPNASTEAVACASADGRAKQHTTPHSAGRRTGSQRTYKHSVSWLRRKHNAPLLTCRLRARTWWCVAKGDGAGVAHQAALILCDEVTPGEGAGREEPPACACRLGVRGGRGGVCRGGEGYCCCCCCSYLGRGSPALQPRLQCLRDCHI